jgi:DNA-binding protein HU-beta
MNKNELVKIIAEDTEMTQVKAKTIVEAIMDSIKKSLINGEKVQLVGFGSWEVKQRAARKGRNPQTGEAIDIAPKKAIKFKPGKGLAEQVNS